MRGLRSLGTANLSEFNRQVPLELEQAQDKSGRADPAKLYSSQSGEYSCCFRSTDRRGLPMV